MKVLAHTIPFSEEELKTELWKDILGWEGYYQVSNLGRVKSLDRKTPNGAGVRRVRSRIISVKTIKNGYPVINVTINNKTRKKILYKTVLSAFVPKAEKSLVCRHIDGNKLNNRLSNLCWGSRKENSIDAALHEQNSAKLSFTDVMEIRFLYENNYLNFNQLSKVFDIGSSSINRACSYTTFYYINNKIKSLEEISFETMSSIKRLISKDLYRGINYIFSKNIYSVVIQDKKIRSRKYCHTFEEALEARNSFMKEHTGNLSYFYVLYSEML